MIKTHKNKIFWGLAAIVLLLLVFLPQIGSFGWGKKLVVKAAETRLKVSLSIDSLSLSWFGPQILKGVHFSNTQLKGDVEELRTAAPLWSFSKIKGPFLIQNGSLAFLQIPHAKIGSVKGAVEGSQFHFTGTTASGTLALEGTYFSENQFSIQIDLKQFPSAALALFSQNLEKWAQLLGSTFNALGKIENPGTVDLALASDHFQSVIKGTLNLHSFQLREPLLARFDVTPELGQTLLRDVNPLFLTSLSSLHPVLLQISPDGFSVPFSPFSLEKLQIGRAVLDMGRIRCRTGKSFASLISLLKASRLSNAREIDAWFTPLPFSLRNGILHTGRMDALIADLHICTWGDIDLLKDRLQMTLGLPADTLRQAFGIKNLSDRFVLKVPMTGSTQDPDLEKGPAAAKIAAMIAGQQIPKKGGIFGGLINQFIQIQEETDVPPPKRPFPWESQ
jgi:hypothetical protein